MDNSCYLADVAEFEQKNVVDSIGLRYGDW
jgi:hypothetical protein